MGLFDWFKRKPKKPTDPLAAYDARIDALAQRAQLLRRSAATLLAVRRDSTGAAPSSRPVKRLP